MPKKAFSNHKLLVLVVCGIAGFAQPASTQDSPSLQGQVLTRVEGTANPAWIKGDIKKILVVDDRKRRLTVAVNYSGFGGTQLSGEILDKNKTSLPGIRVSPQALKPATSKQITMSFELDDSASSAVISSAYLRLIVARPKIAGKKYRENYTYLLPKSWQNDMAPIRVTPEPIGTAASLREDDNTVVQPQRTLKIQYKLSIDNPINQKALLIIPDATTPPAGQNTSSRINMNRSVHESISLADRSAMLRSMAVVDTTAKTSPARAVNPVVIPQNLALMKVHETLPVSSQLIKANTFKYGLSQQEIDKGGKGPSANGIDLLDELRGDVDIESHEIMKIFPYVYPDQNKESGIFYFLPQAYHLEWDTDNGYGLKMLYGASALDGQAGQVLMSARLDAGIDLNEIQFITSLLQAYLARNPGTRFTALRALPIEKPPAVSLAGGLTQLYNVPAEKIVTVAISDALGQIDIAWSTDTITKENMQLALIEDVGINGGVAFTPSGNGLSSREIPVRIKLAEVGTFGEFFWRRNEKWRNQTAYPLRLKYLHALVLNDNQRPVLYSWNLNNTEIAPRAQVEFDGSRVPSWLDGKAKRIWVAYVPVKDCRPCDQQVITAITGGVVSLNASQITLSVLNPVAATGAYQISLKVRSKYFDPRAQQITQKPELIIKEDNKDFVFGPIYLGNRQDGESKPGDPLFEYFIRVTMPDGTTHDAKNWQPSNHLNVSVGKSQIKQALGFLPGNH